MNKLPNQRYISPTDMNGKSVWKELSDEERKQVSYLASKSIYKRPTRVPDKNGAPVSQNK